MERKREEMPQGILLSCYSSLVQINLALFLWVVISDQGMTGNSRQECQHADIHTIAGAGSAAAEQVSEPWDPWALALVMPLLAWAADTHARQRSEETILCTHKPCGGEKRSHHLLQWKGEGRPQKHIYLELQNHRIILEAAGVLPPVFLLL